MGKYFGTDGFRGEANCTLTADHAYKVGRFLGWYYTQLKRRSGSDGSARIVIGKDTRRSSYMFEYSLVGGLVASGADAYLLHVTTTPSVAFVVRTEGFDCGIMISASHNPYYDNGIKLINNFGEKMDESVISLVEAYLDGNAFDMYGRIDGERALIFYTEIHRKYLYPEFPGEKFMTEAVTWNRMAYDGYRIRYYDDIIWIWEYKDDGLTKAGYKVFLDNPRGTALFFREKAVFFHYPLKTKLGMWYGFTCDAMDRCTDAQIAEYIDMPRWLVAPMKTFHNLLQFIRKKR